MRIRSWFNVLVCAVCCALSCAAPSLAVSKYVSSVTGNDSTGTGSTSAPYATPQKAHDDVELVPGDSIFIDGAGVYRDVLGTGRALNITKNNITVTGWPGTGTPIITGAVGIAQGSWTADGTAGVWYATVSVGGTQATRITRIQGLTYQYYSRAVKASAPCAGARQAWLTEVASLATCRTTVWSFYYDAANDRVYGNFNGLLTAPATNDGEWIRGGANLDAIAFTGVTGGRVDSIWGDRINPRETDGSSGYLCVGLNSSGLIFANIRSWDTGDHHLGFAGASNASNVISDCIGWGTGAYGPDSYTVWYSSSGNITGGRAYRSTAYLHGLYKIDGTMLGPRPVTVDGNATGWTGGIFITVGYLGFWTHGAGGAATGQDIEWQDCAVEIDYNHFDPYGGGTAKYPFLPDGFMSGDGTAAVNGSPYDVSSYPVRVVRGSLKYGMGTVWATGAAMAYDRCTLLYDSPVDLNIYRSNTGNYGVMAMFGTNASVLHSGCFIRSTLKPSTDGVGYCVFSFATAGRDGNGHWVAIKTTFVEAADLSARTNPPAMFANVSGATYSSTTLFGGSVDSTFQTYATTNKAELYKCVFVTTNSAKANRRFLNDASDPSTNAWLGSYTFRENVYYGWSTTMVGGSAAASIDTQAEWVGGSATAIAVDRAASFVDPKIDLATGRYQSDSPLIPVAASTAFANVKGLNGIGGANPGCWQNGRGLETRPVLLPW